MKKFPLAALAGAVLSANVSAFEITSDGDWNVRWDNTLKGNLMFRTAKQDADVYNSPTAGHLADDSTFSVDRSNLGVVSSRIDVLSELDVVFKDNFGFRVSGSGWYDYAYKDADNPASNILTWASPSVAVGEYSDEAKDMHYRGGELLDAFVFGNIDIGETSLGIRAGRHTIYWGNSLLAGGAIASIGGSMAPIDFSKAFSVPGTGAKELFMPYGKVSAVWQLTDNLTLNGYYGYEHRRHRLPESGTFFSPAEGLAEKTEFITLPVDPKALAPGVFARVGLESYGDQVEDKEWGVNVQYYFEDLGLETSFIYLNYVDKNLHGLHGGIDATKFADFGGTPVVNPAQRTITVGSGRWLFKDDIDLYGISLSKEIAGISTGLDIVYRKNTGLAPDLAASLGRFYNVPAPLVPAVQASGSGVIEGDFFGYDSENYLGPVGDTVSVVANGLGLLSDNGIWEGGSYIVEAVFSKLQNCTEHCQLLDRRVKEGRTITSLGVVFSPTWYQVLPGWDMSMPISASYTFNGKSPFTFGGDGERGNASVGVSFNIEETWNLSAKYNMFFGPANAGIGGLLKDRDNIAITIKRTF